MGPHYPTRKGTASRLRTRPPSLATSWRTRLSMQHCWGSGSDGGSIARKKALPSLSPHRAPSRKCSQRADLSPKGPLHSAEGSAVGRWGVLRPNSIYCPITLNGHSLPGAPGGWGGCPKGSPSRTCREGFPLEQPVFNDYKGTGV